MNKKNVAKNILLFFLFSAFSLAPSFTLAKWGMPATPPGGLPNADLGAIVMNITNWLLGFVAIIAVLALILGGVRYLTAAGDDSAVEGAKNIITQAVIGLLIVGISYSIVVLVVKVWINGEFN